MKLRNPIRKQIEDEETKKWMKLKFLFDLEEIDRDEFRQAVESGSAVAFDPEEFMRR